VPLPGQHRHIHVETTTKQLPLLILNNLGYLLGFNVGALTSIKDIWLMVYI